MFRKREIVYVRGFGSEIHKKNQRRNFGNGSTLKRQFTQKHFEHHTCYSPIREFQIHNSECKDSQYHRVPSNAIFQHPSHNRWQIIYLCNRTQTYRIIINLHSNSDLILSNRLIGRTAMYINKWSRGDQTCKGIIPFNIDLYLGWYNRS